MVFFSTVFFSVVLVLAFVNMASKSEKDTMQGMEELVVSSYSVIQAARDVSKAEIKNQNEWLAKYLADSFYVTVAAIFEPNQHKVTTEYNPLELTEYNSVLKKLLDKVDVDSSVKFINVNDYIFMVRPLLSKGNKQQYLALGYKRSEESIRGLFATITEMLVILFLLYYFFLLIKIRHSVVEPIQSLVETMQEISDTKNYGIRAEVLSSNEIGYLAQSFNEMLTTIQNYIDYKDRAERKISKLMTKIFPTYVLEKMRVGEVVNKKYDLASVMFVDIVNFTTICHTLTINELEKLLTSFYVQIDELVEYHHIEKIKTIGDCYMLTSKVEEQEQEKQLKSMLALASSIIHLCDNKTFGGNIKLSVRVGIAYDTIFAGIIGKDKLFFDVWGKAVNLAARLESAAEENTVYVTEVIYQKTHNLFQYENVGKLKLKGFDKQNIYKYYPLKQPKK